MSVEWQGKTVELGVDRRHQVVAHAIRADLVDEDGEPVVRQRYVIDGPDGFRFEGCTDARGRVRLLVPRSGDYDLRFAGLESHIVDLD